VVLARDAGIRWVRDACHRLSASLAYAALFSIFPLLLLSVTGIGFLLGDDASARQRILASVAQATLPELHSVLDQTLQSMQTHRTARGLGAIVGTATLLLGASGVFSELEASLNFIWRVKGTQSQDLWSALLKAAKGKAFAFAVVVVAGAVMLVSLVVSTALGALGALASSTVHLPAGGAMWQAADIVSSIALLTLILASIYRWVPQTDVAWRDVIGGAFLAAILFAALKYLLARYLAHLGGYAAYGAVGAVLVLLTWIYLASFVLFYGAEFSRVYAERFGSLAPAPRRPDGAAGAVGAVGPTRLAAGAGRLRALRDCATVRMLEE
jgi:membrane protein